MTGCRVTDKDVHRWETTEFGPLKLSAVVTHDKYALPLRLEAAMGLIRMKPRSGKRVGIEKLVESLRDMQPEERRKVVNGLVPLMAAQMDKPPPVTQGLKPEEKVAPDPSAPFKDAMFAILTYDKPALVSDEATSKSMREALTRWGNTNFDQRIALTGQLYGLEQIFRLLGTDGVRQLPQLLKPEGSFDRIVSLVAELGDPATKEATGKKLVELATFTEGKAWFDQKKPMVKQANEAAGYNVPDERLNKQVSEYQDEQTTRVFASMRKVGSRPVVEYLLAAAQDEARPVKRRQAAVAALEGRLERNSVKDAEAMMKIAGGEKTPDEVRDLAFARVSELARENVADKLYGLFDQTKDPKRWKIRWVAGSTLLKMSQAKDVTAFFEKLPPAPAKGFAMAEALEFGGAMAKMNPPPAKDAIVAALNSAQLTPKLVALGYFYAAGKAADVATVQALAENKTALPATEDAESKWQWQVPKSGGKPGETEQKELKDIGDFVKTVVIPAMTARK